jgi:hypothetical protein
VIKASLRAFVLVGASVLLHSLLGTLSCAAAQEAAAPGKVVVSGVVPDESRRPALHAPPRGGGGWGRGWCMERTA